MAERDPNHKTYDLDSGVILCVFIVSMAYMVTTCQGYDVQRDTVLKKAKIECSK